MLSMGDAKKKYSISQQRLMELRRDHGLPTTRKANLVLVDEATLKEWLGSAWGAIPMALFVVTAFKHGLDGLKVSVSDYVNDDGNRIALYYLLDMAAIAGASVALFALARIVFGPAAA